jgi:hypothetical protein
MRYLLLAPLAAYAAIVCAMYLMQRGLLYHPENKGLTPALAGLVGVTQHQLATPDGERIVVWYAPAPHGSPVILYFHGNAGEIGDRHERFRYYQSAGFGACFVSYRGFGGSTGAPSETGTLIDAETAYQWLLGQGVAASRIAIVGESLGTGVAVQLAARHEVGAVALEAPFTSTADVAARVYWWLPVHWLMKDQYRSIDHIGQVRAPLLLVHGEADGLVPVSFGKRLFAAALAPKELHLVADGSHDAIHDETTWAREVDFFSRQLRP